MVDLKSSSATPNPGSACPAANPSPTDISSIALDPDQFVFRHLGPRPGEIQKMLQLLGLDSLNQMADQAVPASIRLRQPLQLPPPCSEHDALRRLKSLAQDNRVYRSFIGQGYYDCVTPPVIQRNLLENPGWYTQYTPYQAEISQGRLEALLHFQTLIAELTSLDIANASLLDEATAAAEAMIMCRHLKANATAKSIQVAADCHPQTIAVIQTRAKPLGIQVTVADPAEFILGPEVFALMLSYPTTNGTIVDYQPLIQKAHQAGVLAIVVADLLSLCLLRPPGEFGADVVVGSAQRFGVPMAYGGPHAAFFATRDAFKRQMPGRLVGVSHDSQGKPAFRLALQTREQHIRREKATSNICTAQVLLAITAAMYAIYHGPDGLKRIAQRVHRLTQLLALGLRRLGHDTGNQPFFDTLSVRLKSRSSGEILSLAEKHEINLRLLDHRTVGISLDETTTVQEVVQLWRIFNDDRPAAFSPPELESSLGEDFPAPHARQSPYLKQTVFQRYRSETEMLRYLRRLESRDLSLATAMIPLGSCTMKLNAAAEMFAFTWPEFARLHPFVPLWQAKGYQQLFRNLSAWLAEITGLPAVSLQPNAGSQGEYAGLLTIRGWHEHQRQGHRNVCLIPQSAHGTNPASAVMAGFTVVPVACDAQGNIDLADLRAKASLHAPRLGAVMITYPSTHGVFENTVVEVCQVVHDHGGLVYLDGANLNAQVGLCRPGDIGADVCHLNLHKTFAIPHGGGGPGMAPIAAKEFLAAFLPGHPFLADKSGGPAGPVSAAPWGSASILTIPWVYIQLLGAPGLTLATQVAILNANYVARRLEPYFPTLYRGQNDLVAHECILDLRRFHLVTVEDVAKRLMDYGFHAPTISWPVPNTMMVEPTESESKAELDRFCEAMMAIHAEILEVESGQVDAKDNVLKHAPHPALVVAGDSWNRPYSRERAAYPVPGLREYKFWPAVGRIDNVQGDRHLICTCTSLDFPAETAG